jgi:hypothetical protein
MGYWLDIYVCTAERNPATLERFVSKYADLSKDGVRNDFEVRLTGSEEGFRSGTLAETLAHGLAYPDRAFTLYLENKYPEHQRVMVYFSPHGRLLLGLSVEEEVPEGTPNDAAAEQVLQELRQAFSTAHGLIAFELPPEEADKEFDSHLL